jgi:hypothetical protein
VISDGRLYLRHQDSLLVYDIQGRHGADGVFHLRARRFGRES